MNGNAIMPYPRKWNERKRNLRVSANEGGDGEGGGDGGSD